MNMISASTLDSWSLYVSRSQDSLAFPTPQSGTLLSRDGQTQNAERKTSGDIQTQKLSTRKPCSSSQVCTAFGPQCCSGTDIFRSTSPPTSRASLLSLPGELRNRILAFARPQNDTLIFLEYSWYMECVDEDGNRS